MTALKSLLFSMCRAVILRLVSLGVLIFTLWSQITCEGDKIHSSCKACEYNHKDYPVSKSMHIISKKHHHIEDQSGTQKV